MTASLTSVVQEGEPGSVSVVVCGAFQWGVDSCGRKEYNHRREWVRDRLKELAGIISCGVWAYAVMANHCRLVLRIDPAVVRRWTVWEVDRSGCSCPRGSKSDG